jgi:hypothetical protein
MKLTLNIPDNSSSKAIPLIAYLKSLDFLTVEEDENISIPEWHQQIVNDRIKNSNSEELLDWETVKDTFKLD